MSIEDDPEIIFLEPDCANIVSDETGRLWCDDDVWGTCNCEEGCEAKPTKYIRFDLHEKALREERRLALEEIKITYSLPCGKEGE